VAVLAGTPHAVAAGERVVDTTVSSRPSLTGSSIDVRAMPATALAWHIPSSPATSADLSDRSTPPPTAFGTARHVRTRQSSTRSCRRRRDRTNDRDCTAKGPRARRKRVGSRVIEAAAISSSRQPRKRAGIASSRIVSKWNASPFHSGECHDWRKIKAVAVVRTGSQRCTMLA